MTPPVWEGWRGDIIWIYLSAFIIHLDSSLRSRKGHLWKALDKSVPRNSYTDYMYICFFIYHITNQVKLAEKTYLSSLSLSCVHLHPVFTKEPMAVANHRISAFPSGEMDIAAGATRREWTLYLWLISPFPDKHQYLEINLGVDQLLLLRDDGHLSNKNF